MFQQNRTLPAGTVPNYCLFKENITRLASTLAFLFLFLTGLHSQNNALSFDGANDNVAIPALGNGLSQFTLETWFNATSIATSPGLNGIFNTNSWVAGDIHFQINSTRVQLAVNGSTPVEVAYNSITLNKWHHLAVTYNSVTKKITFYINGTLLQSVTLATAVHANFTAAQIGAWTTQRYFAGAMDEYRIWNSERTLSEIKNNMFSSLTGTETGLLASFSCNQGTAGGTNTGITTLLNSKGSNNGTLANFALSGASSNWIASTTPSIITDNCLIFNGTNNYVNCGSVNPSKFTIEAWALPNAVSADQAIVSTLFTTANTGCELHIGADSYPYITIRNGAAWLDIKAPAKAVAGTWIHLAATFDGSTCKLFVNGVKVATQTGISYIAGTNGLLLGVRSGPSLYFQGKIDDVRIWNRVVTEANLIDSLNTVLSGSEKGLLVHYSFNQGNAGGTNTGLTTLLSSSGTNHGTLTNFTLSGATSNWVTSFLPAPVSHVTNFAGSLVSNKMTLTWTDATGPVIPDGYLIYVSKTNTFTNPADGVLPLDDNDLSDGTGVVRVARGIQTYNGWINEDFNTVYYFRICPFTNPGIYIKYYSPDPVPTAQTTSKQLFYQVSIPSFQSAGRTLWGDYNNDGWLDYIASGYNDGWNTLFTNNHNNTFSANLAYNRSNAGSSDWLDFNNDGNLDIAGYSRIYLNSGNGASFNEVTIPSVSDFADLDKDGVLDAISNDYLTKKISALKNNGSLLFSEFPGNYFKDTDGKIETFDYNKDGFLDIVISGRYSIDYKLLTTIYKNEGNGKFTEQKQFLLEGLAETNITTGDIDADGWEDIILSGLNDQEMHKLLVYKNNNGLSFTKAVVPLAAGLVKGTTNLADINNDGLHDILFTGDDGTTGTFNVLKNNGNMSFTKIYNFSNYGLIPYSEITDFNNDGALDVIVHGSVILQNSSAVINSAPQKITIATASLINNGVQFQWSATDDKTPSSGLTYNLRIGKTSGAQDILSTTSLPSGQRKQLKAGNVRTNSTWFQKLTPGTYYWSVQAIDNGYKGGAFSNEQSIYVDSVPASKLEAKKIDQNTLRIKWKNGNGNKRALFCKVGGDGRTKPKNNLTYTASITFGEGDQIGNTGWYCLYNGIGDSVVVQNLTNHDTYVFEVFEYFGNKGAEKYMYKTADGNPAIFGTSDFTEQADILGSGSVSGSPTVSLGDYDNDGLLDILYTNNSQGPVVLKNMGQLYSVISAVPTNYFGSVATWVDFNNDGWLDIAFAGEKSGSWFTRPKYVRIYRNDQNNIFTDVTNDLIPGLTSGSMAFADYDNDGDADFFVSGIESAWDAATTVIKSKIYRNNGTPTDCFTEQTEIILPELLNGDAKWGDLNNDGWTDLLFSGVSTDGYYYLYQFRNNKNNSFTGNVILKIRSKIAGCDYNNSKIKIHDLDKDSYNDFLIYIGSSENASYQVTDTTILFHNNGDGTFLSKKYGDFPRNTGYNNIDIGDFNNDKSPDIVFAASTKPDLIRLYQNDFPQKTFTLNPDFNFTWASFTSAFVNFNSATFGDYDNDGDADILTTNYDHLYFLNNNSQMKSGVFKPNTPPAAPTNIIATQKPGELIINWNEVTTDETANLTYNVKLVSEGKILNSVNSNVADGKRLIPEMGNTGFNNFATFKKLPVGNYSISVQAVDGAFAGGAWSTPVTVELKNTKAFFTFDTVCYKAATKLSDLSTSTKKVTNRKWKYNNIVISTDSVAHFVFPHSGTGTITLVITDGEGTKDSVTHAIKIKARPTASYSAATVCLGSTTVFVNNSSRNGSGTVTWNWNYDNGDPASTDSIPFNKVYGLAKTYKTKLIVTASNSCADTLAKDVIVGAFPNAITSVSGKTVFCQGDSVQLIAENNPLYNYQWKLDNNDLSNANLSTFKVKLNSGDYSVRITNPLANCIATSAITNVTVLPAPVSPFISVSGVTQFCQGDSVTLSVSNTAGYDYQWKLNGGAVGNSKNSFVAKSSGNFTVSVSNSSGCTANSSSSIPVIIYPKPAVSTISRSGSTTFCQGGSVELSVPANAGYTYHWQNSGADIQGATTNTFIAMNSGIYSLSLSNSDGCVSKTEQVTVNSLTAPAPPSILYSRPLPIQFCEGDSVVLSATNISGYSYQWKLNGGAAGTNRNSIAARTAGIWSLVVTNSSGCSAVSTNSPSVVVYPKPAVSTISKNGPSTICAGERVELSVPAINGYKYQWSRSGADLSGANSSYYTAFNSGDYSLLISNADNCSSKTNAVTVLVNKKPEKPVIDKGNYSEGKCLGETPIKLSVENMAGYNYKWYRNGAAVSSKNFVEGLLEQGYYFVETSVNNCSNKSDSLNVFFAPAAEKPIIFAQGPNSWYLASSIIGPDIKYRWFYNGELIPGADKYYYAAFRQLGKYNLSISRDNSCYTLSDTIKIPVISKILGLDDIDPFYGMKIYPNPTSGLFSIEMENQMFGEITVDILSQDGRKIFSLKFDKSTTHFFSKIDISGQGKGLYLMNIRLDKYSKVEKLILE
jgi:hypothetical protein